MKPAVTAVCAALAILAVADTHAAPNPEAVGLSRERLERIDAMIEQRIAAGELTGAITIVARRGQVAHVSVHGVMDLETRRPMRDDTLFRIASMTKPIVGVGVMLMVEENKLRLDDPVSRYIPEFRNLRVAVARPAGGSGAAPGFDTVPPQREVTIKDLLTHVSGLGSGPMSNSTIEPDRAQRRRDARRLHSAPRRHGARVPARHALGLQPRRRLRDARPRARDRVGPAARRILRAAHLRAARHARHHVLADRRRSGRGSRPSIDARSNGLAKVVSPNDTLSRNVYFRGSGGLYSTAESYVPFGIMLANGGELGGVRLLSRKSVEMLGAVHVPDTLPGRPAGEGFGLSVRVVTDHAARGTLLSDGTYGWSGAQGTHFFVDPKEQLVGVLMIQTPNVTEIRGDFENLVAQAIVD